MNLRQITLVPNAGSNIVLGSVVYTNGSPSGFTIDNLQLDTAPRRVYVNDLALVPGAVVAPGQLAARDVMVSGKIVGADADAVRTLRALLVRTLNNGSNMMVGVRWTIDDDTRQLHGHLSGSVVTRSTGSHFLEYEFSLVCPNPIAYATDQSSGNWGGGTPLVNTGTANAWPEIVVTASSTTVVVTNSTTGETLTITGVTAGNTITIVTEPGYENVTIGGTPVLNKLSTTSRFPRLVAGNNNTVISGGTATATWYAGWSE